MVESTSQSAPETPSLPQNDEVNTATPASSLIVPTSLPPPRSSSPTPSFTISSTLAESSLTSLSADTPPTPSPRKRRPPKPKKGILKPAPPPLKPGLTGKLRDALGSFNPKFFDASIIQNATNTFREAAAGSESTAGPSLPQQQGVNGMLGGVGEAVGGAAAVVGNWGGRLGRLVGSNLQTLQAQAQAAGVPLPPIAPPSPSPKPPPTDRAASPSPQPRAAPAEPPAKPLKKATFLLPSLSITYPISSSTAPWSEELTAARIAVEEKKAEDVAREKGREWWTRERVVRLYEEACKGREEVVRMGVRNGLLTAIPSSTAPPTAPRQLLLTSLLSTDPQTTSTSTTAHLVSPPLDRHAAEALADVLSVEWGLGKLALEGGCLDGDDSLKPILHALLISGTLPYLCIAGNKKLKPQSFRLVGAYMVKARTLRYLDLSDNILDKKSMEYIAAALVPASASPITPIPSASTASPAGPTTTDNSLPTPSGTTVTPTPEVDETEEDPDDIADRERRGLFMPHAPLLRDVAEDEAGAGVTAVQTLRMDGCSLKTASLESLAQSIRKSDIKNLSLRRNRITNLGAVAVALMMRDYPDTALAMNKFSPSLTPASTESLTLESTDAGAPQSPPKVIRNHGYAPYLSRTRKAEVDLEAPLPPIPNVVSSLTSGITSRTGPLPPPPRHPGVGEGSQASDDMPERDKKERYNYVKDGNAPDGVGGASLALQKQVKMLDGMDRLGSLLTLDLKANEIRGGVTYIAQVLKRNRTLKVLNLSENRIDHLGLQALAEALKYNSTLETLDLSQNPCCGPNLDGIASLRSAFTLNSSLKRLFLANTQMTTEGAIAIAEFLPEAQTLLHFDLTENPLIETAGIMALAVALRSNQILRCLDLSILPNSPEVAELSQSILQSCIRNTESAVTAKGGKMAPATQDAVWAPIKKSVLVRQVKEAESAKAVAEAKKVAVTPTGMAREQVYTLKPEGVLRTCEDTAELLQRFIDGPKDRPLIISDRQEKLLLIEQAKILLERVADLIQDTTDPIRLERLLSLNDLLNPQIEQAETLIKSLNRKRPISTELKPLGRPMVSSSSPRSSPNNRRHMKVPSLEISSPNFSITNSDDDDSDAEELLSAGPRSIALALSKDSAKSLTTPEKLSLSGIGLEESVESKDIEEEPESCPSPMEKVKRDWIEEEGEIFRRGFKLGVAEEDEVEEKRDVSGEELKLQILETEVERSPHKPIEPLEEEDDIATPQ